MHRLAGCVALLLAWIVSGCSGVRPPAPVLSAADVEVARLAEAWFARSQVDTLEAYGLEDGSVGFGLARKWQGTELRLLLYVVQPDHLDEVAYLMLRRPGATAEVFTYATPQLYEVGRAGGVRTRTVIRVAQLGARWGLGAAADLAARLVEPVLPGDLVYRDAGRETIEGEPCRRVDAEPLRSLHGVTRVELAISERSGVALRTTYYAGDRLLGSATVSPADVGEAQGGALPERWHLAPVDAAPTDLVLRNRMTDVPVPDVVFTRQGLENQRFPKF
jgi:hypothetical protein